MTSTYSDALCMLRNALVAKRREIGKHFISACESAGDAGKLTDTTGSEFGQAMASVQAQIDAVDRAIADEKKLGPS